MNRRVEFLPHGWRDLEGLDRSLQQRVILAQPSQFSAFEAGMPFVFSKDTSKVSTTF